MTHRSKRIEVGRLFAVATAGLALALPAPAFAAQSSQNAYSSPAGAVQGEVLGQAGQSPGGVLGSTSEAGAPAAGQQAPAVSAEQRPSSSSKLPFTGLDIGLLLGAGGLFMGVGLAMRRLSTRPDFA